MATITQSQPVVGTVASGLSESYIGVISVTGSTGSLTFSTTAPSADLTVSPQGVISTTGSLTNGAYYVAGTVVDSNGNNGIWSYTLNVIGAISPGTAVTPVQPVLPSGTEMLVPFQIDPATGGVAVITDYPTILAQHIKTIILTELGERVMNPQYGFGLQRAVFQPINAALPSTLQADLTAAITSQEPRVNVSGVTVSSNPFTQSTLLITVKFSVVPFNDVNIVTVSTGGTILQVNS